MQNVENVGKGNYLLTIDYKNDNLKNDNNNNDDDDKSVNYPQYEPGHVLALEIQPHSKSETTEEAESPYQITEKTSKDLEKNDGWLRGPYTVGFGYGTDNTNTQSNENGTNDGFKLLIKEVGYKSHVLATSPPGTPVVFGGRFHVPIAEGIRSAAAAVEESTVDSGNDGENRGETKRVVMVSTGVGVGPCVGAIEELLTASSPSSDAETIDSIDLIASYRTREEISMASALEKLQKDSSGTSSNSETKKPHFYWKSVVTSEEGRLSSNGPESLRDNYLQSSSSLKSDTNSISAVSNTHYHIIGNGQLVSEWKKGLAKAGVPSARITVEAYFNHAAKPDSGAIDTICEAVLGLESNSESKDNAEREAALS